MHLIVIVNLLMNSYHYTNKLPASYYLNSDVVFLAKDLIGKVIHTNIDNNITSGMIVETEAYKSVGDKASHAYCGRRTSRNEKMYDVGGIAYVYMCYGIHYLFNIVTNKKNIPDAVLIRAIEPKHGLNIMNKRIPKPSIEFHKSGPGRLSKALGIDMRLNGKSLNSNTLWITNNTHSNSFDVVHKKRIGIHYAQEDKNLPWRFYIKNNKFVSMK